MRLLALSDIHGRLAAVERLRVVETNRFDAVIVAGDIGSSQAPAIMAILATFACPVLYVYGNWDHQLAYDLNFGDRCRHLHHRGINIDGLFFTGFSGLPTHWGKNPIAAAVEAAVDNRHHAVLALLAETEAAASAGKARIEQERTARLNELAAVTKNRKTKVYYQQVKQIEKEAAFALDREAARVKFVERTKDYRRYLEDSGAASADILKLNRQKMAALIREIGPSHTIVVTHERLSHTSEDMYGVPLFLFGHRHGYDDKLWGGSRFVNVSALDQLVFVAPKSDDGSPDKRRRCLRIADLGSYVVLEIDRSGRIEVEPRPLWDMPDGWVRLRGSAITPDRPPMLEQPEPTRPPASMSSLPDKLHEMIAAGVDENLIQTIFDALVEADDAGRQFINIYLADEVAVLFSNDRAEADHQLRMFIERVGVGGVAFERGPATWHERVVQSNQGPRPTPP